MKKKIFILAIVALLMGLMLACDDDVQIDVGGLVIDDGGIGTERNVMITDAAQNSQAMDATATVTAER